MAKWRLDLKDWRLANLKSAEFILKEGQKAFDVSYQLSQRITARAFSLLVMVILFTYIVIAYVFNAITSFSTEMKPLIILSLIFAGVLLVCIYKLIGVVSPRQINSPGRDLTIFADADYLENPEYSKEEQYLLAVLCEIENCQHTTVFNDNSNKQRMATIKLVLKIILWSFFTCVLGLLGATMQHVILF